MQVNRLSGPSIFCTLLASCHPLVAEAQESLSAETTAPKDATEIPTSMERAFERKEYAPGRLAGLRALVEDLPPFLRDAKLLVKPRSYFLDREDPGGNERQAWALGGEVSVESGQWQDLVQVGLSYYTSQRLHGPDQKGYTGLLTPDQEAINTLGQAWVMFGREEHFAMQFGRMALPLPYINRHDIRMIPITHEAYMMGRYGTGRDLVIGHVAEQKDRDSDEFVPLSQLAGARGTDKGVSLIGGAWTTDNGFEIGAISQYGWDTFNTFYTEAAWELGDSEDWSFQFGGQYTDQRSVGDDLVGDFDTRAWGVTGSVGYLGAIATLALTDYAADAFLRSPFGGTPSYNSMIVSNFDLPGERAARLGLSYNLDAIGLSGWSGFFNLVLGSNAQSPDTGESLDDRDEYNLTIDYKPTQGQLDGLWLRLRYAHVDFGSQGSTDDLRLIINYALPAL